MFAQKFTHKLINNTRQTCVKQYLYVYSQHECISNELILNKTLKTNIEHA